MKKVECRTHNLQWTLQELKLLLFITSDLIVVNSGS